jgi:hypothetical protein
VRKGSPADSDGSRPIAALGLPDRGILRLRTPQPTPGRNSITARKWAAGYWREARFRFERVVAREPETPARTTTSPSPWSRRRFRGAFEEYKKAVALDSADKSIRQNYTHFAEIYSAYTKKVGKVSPAP